MEDKLCGRSGGISEEIIVVVSVREDGVGLERKVVDIGCRR